MAICTMQIKTEIPESPKIDQSRNYLGLEFGAYNQQTGDKEPTYHHAESNTVNRIVAHVKSEAHCDAHGYVSERPDQLECIKNECNGHRSYVYLKYKDPLAVLDNTLDVAFTFKQANGEVTDQNEQFTMLQSVLNTINKAERVSDEDLPNTSDEESGEEIELNWTLKSQRHVEQFKRETNEIEMVTDTLAHDNQQIQQGDSTFGVNKGVNEERNGQSEQYDIDNVERHVLVDRQDNLTKTLDVNNSRTFECPYCIKRFNTKYKLKRHSAAHKAKQKKDKPLYNCHLCLKSYNRKDNYDYHMEIHDDRTYTCGLCNTVYRHVSDLVKHYKHKHSNQHGTYKCSLCLKTYTTYKGFNVHMDTHKGVRHECRECGKTFSTKGTLTNHLKLHSDDPNNPTDSYVTCYICQKLFTTMIGLDLHMQVHTGTQKFICKVCDALFSRAADLKRHQYTHTGEKPYKCTDCGKCYRNPGDLGRHRNKHIGNYHTCKICDKTYVRFDEFTRHMTTHDTSAETGTGGSDKEVNQYTCKLCPAVLSSELYYLNHMKKHDGQTVKQSESKLYPCDQCSLFFSTSSNRARHKRRNHHSKDSLLVCDMCTKVFTANDSLKLHIKTVHLNQKPYPCQHCKQGFYKKKDRKRHIEKIHSLDELTHQSLP